MSAPQPRAAQRTEDRSIYLAENRYREPKQITRVLTDRARESGCAGPGARVADLGCAAGEFLFHFQHALPKTRCTGVDLLPELLEKARARVPGVEFLAGSVLEPDLLPEHGFDVVFLQGVHSIFDDFAPCFSNLLRWTRPGGRIFVFGPFNPAPLDVWVQYRRDGDPPTHREAGWNLFSCASVSRFLDRALGAGAHTFTPFELPFDLPPHADDPARTWTLQDAAGRRHFTNGLSLLVPLSILEIRP